MISCYLKVIFYGVGNHRVVRFFCIFLCAIISISATTIQAQTQNIEFGISSGFYTATNSTLPFWFYSNVQGKVDANSTNFLNELSFNKLVLQNDEYSVGISGNTVFRLSDNSTIFFPELYLNARAYGLQLDAGRFANPIGLNNHQLSVGSMMFSNHPTPVPKISISMSEFSDIPLTDGYLQFKGMFSHGWFDKDRHITNPFLHQKYFYLRLNVGPLSGTGGIIHNVMWGGTDPQYGRLPQSFGDFLRVISGLGAAEKSSVPEGEISNVIGNSVAAYEFDLLYQADAFDLSINRLFYLEDKVSTRFRSPWDGAWALNLVMDDPAKLVNALTYEHFNTKRQDSRSEQLIGRQSYYNHYFYLSGWSYEKKVLGMPLIVYDEEIGRVVDNIMIGHHLGFKGSVSERIQYKTLFTYARHYGTIADRTGDNGEVIPLDELRSDQYSWMLDIDYNFDTPRGLQLNFKIAYDFGEFYDRNFGIMIGATWQGIFKTDR